MAESPHLQRTLGLGAAISIVVGTVIGSSIFMKPATMAAQLGSPLLLLLVWVLAGVVSLFGGMINAEIGSALPLTGGQYVYFRHFYGRFFAYLYGWASFMVINTAAIAGIAFIFAQYSGYLFELPRFSPALEQSCYLELPGIGRFYLLEQAGVKALATLLICLLSWLNVRSVSLAGGVQVFFTLLKVGALLFLVAAIFGSGQGDSSHFTQVAADFNPSFWPAFSAFMAATTGALAAYDGWNNLGFVGGELRDPRRQLPRGLLLGLGLCILLYVLTSQAYLYMLPIEEMRASAWVASDALSLAWGAGSGLFVACLVMLSTAGAVNGNVLPCARILYAMSEERNFFAWAGRVHPRHQTPANALWLQCAWACILVCIGTFDLLMDMFVFITWVFYAFAGYVIFRLRRSPDLPANRYKMWGYPVLPVIFMLFAVIYVGMTLYNDIQMYLSGKTRVVQSVLGLLFTLVGVPLYYWGWRGKDKV